MQIPISETFIFTCTCTVKGVHSINSDMCNIPSFYAHCLQGYGHCLCPLSYCSYGQSCEMFNEVLLDFFFISPLRKQFQ